MTRVNSTTNHLLDDYTVQIDELLKNVATLTPDIDISQSLMLAQSSNVYKALAITNEVLKESLSISGLYLDGLDVKASQKGIEIFLTIKTSENELVLLEVDSEQLSKNKKSLCRTIKTIGNFLYVNTLLAEDNFAMLSLDKIRNIKELLNKNFKKIIPFLGLTMDMLGSKNYRILYARWRGKKVEDSLLCDSPISATQKGLYITEYEKVLITLESVMLNGILKSNRLLYGNSVLKL